MALQSAVRLSCIVFIGQVLLGTLQGQITTPQPFLATVSPPVAQAGTTAELTVTGTDLDGASRLHFSIPGIDCKPKLDAKQQPVANKFTVVFPANAACGPCDVRVVARYGISNARGFAITSLPVVALPATALSADKAFKATLNSVVTGNATKQGSSFIAFDAKKGQRVLAICKPALLDSRMDAELTLQRSDGTILDRLRNDGLLDFTPPADGTFTLRVHDLMFRGDAESPFAVVLTTAPLVEYAFDAGSSVTLYGRNLPKGTDAMKRYGDSMQRLQVPAEEAKRLLALNPIKAVRFGAESEVKDAIKPPCKIVGWLPERGKPRFFTFEAKKGQVFWIEVNCAKLGIIADPYLIVEKVVKDTATFIAESNDRTAIATKEEFDAGWFDPSYRFEAKEDGTYRVKLRNLFGNGPSEPFELTVQPDGSDYDLVAIPAALPKAKTVVTVDINAAPLWRGGVAALKVFAVRRNGFSGPIELSAEGLPPGVTFGGGLIRDGQSVGYASFIADEKAADWAGAVKLHGKTGGNAVGAMPVFKVTSTAKEPVFTRFTDEVVLGVVAGDAPVMVEAASQVFEAVANTKLSIPLQVKRRGDFADAFKLAALGLNDAVAEADIAAKATASKLDLDLAKLKLAPGDYQVVLQGSAKFKHKRLEDPKAAAKDVTFLVHSKPISVRIKPVEKK